MRHQHKIVILKYVKGKFWLMLLPVLRGIFSWKYDVYYWFRNVWMDIIVILIILISAILKWYFVQFKLNEKEIYVRKGALFRRDFCIPFSVISTVCFCRPLIFRPFKAVKFCVCTDSYRSKKRKQRRRDTLVVTEIDYLQICNNMGFEKRGLATDYIASKKELLIFSTLFSSTFSGLIYLGTLIIRGEKIVGEKIKIKIFSVINMTTETMIFAKDNTASFAVAVVVIISVAWVMSFAKSFLRHMNFKIRSFEKGLEVENGHFSRWKYYVNSSKINYIDLRQNMLMKTAHIVSAHISCAGYKTVGNGQSVFIPVTTKKQAAAAMKELLPGFTQSNNLVSAKQARVWMPLTFVIGVFVGVKYLSSIFSEWRSLIVFLGVMLEVMFLYLLAVKITAKLTTGIGVSEETLSLRYCKAFRFHTVVVPKARIAYIKIQRTPFQQISGSCDVIVYTKGEGLRGHRVSGIDYKKIVFLMRN